MKCQEYFDRIGLMLDNELTPDKQATLFAHLSICDDCRDSFDVVLRARAVMHQDEPEYPADLDNRILAHPSIQQALSMPPAKPPLPARVRSYARTLPVPIPLAAAAILLIAALSVTADRSLLSLKNGVAEGPAAQVRPPTVEVLYAIPGVEVIGTAASATTPGTH